MSDPARTRTADTLAVLLLLTGGAARAQRPPSIAGVVPPPGLGEVVAAADATMLALAEDAVGLSVAVADGDRVLWSQAYGYESLEEGRPATPSTLFRLYSVSKPMTAAAAARLLEQGRLAADSPVQRYVPGFPDKGVPITPMQLATHTSGIRHYADDGEARSRRHCESVADALEIFKNDPLVRPPGQGETSSSWGFVLLSGVLEGATEKEFAQAMQELVFDPLGATSFMIDDPTRDIPRRASFYQQTGPGSFSLAEQVDNTCKWGAGAWLGTAGEVAQFAAALVDGSLLQPETQELMLSGRLIYRAQGWSTGGMAFMLADDERDLGIALLSNATGEALGLKLRAASEEPHALFAHRTSAAEAGNNQPPPAPGRSLGAQRAADILLNTDGGTTTPRDTLLLDNTTTNEAQPWQNQIKSGIRESHGCWWMKFSVMAT